MLMPLLTGRIGTGNRNSRIRFAGKLTGKVGKNTVGYIIAQDAASSFIVPFEDYSSLVLAGESWSNIGRYKRDFWSNSFVGLMGTDRRYKNGSNTTAGLDCDVSLPTAPDRRMWSRGTLLYRRVAIPAVAVPRPRTP